MVSRSPKSIVFLPLWSPHCSKVGVDSDVNRPSSSFFDFIPLGLLLPFATACQRFTKTPKPIGDPISVSQPRTFQHYLCWAVIIFLRFLLLNTCNVKKFFLSPPSLFSVSVLNHFGWSVTCAWHSPRYEKECIPPQIIVQIYRWNVIDNCSGVTSSGTSKFVNKATRMRVLFVKRWKRRGNERSRKSKRESLTRLFVVWAGSARYFRLLRLLPMAFE